MKKIEPVCPVRVVMTCDKCGKGVMLTKPGNVMLACNPPRYEHYCTECGHKELYTKVYPCIEFMEVKE